MRSAAGSRRVWNATLDVSDDAIHAEEDAAAATLAGHNRHSISTDARPLVCPAPATSPHIPPRPARRPRFADPRCGCLRHCRWRGTHAPRPRDLSGPRFPAPAPLTPLAREAKVNTLKAQWTARSSRNAPPQEYNGPNDTHLAESTATFATRKAAQACFGCDVHGQLVPNQPH